MGVSLILGDVHLGKGANLGKTNSGSLFSSRINDQFTLLDWVLDQALDHYVSNIIITGDIFEDPQPQPVLVVEFLSWLKKCQANDVQVHMIVGNHDSLRQGNVITSILDVYSEAELDGVFVYKNISTVLLDNVAFVFVPFRDRKSYFSNSNAEALSLLQNSISYELSSIPLPFTKFLVGHLALAGSIPIGDEIDDLTNELFCPLEMFKGYDYVVMGHIHKPQTLQVKPRISHIGSMDVSDFGEIKQTKQILLFDSDNPHQLTEIDIPTRQLQSVKIVIPESQLDTTEYVLNELKNNSFKQKIVKVEIVQTHNTQLPLDKKRINEHLMSEGCFAVSNILLNKQFQLTKKETEQSKKFEIKQQVNKAFELWANQKIEADKRDKFIELTSQLSKDVATGVKE